QFIGPFAPTPFPTEVPALHLPSLTEVPGVLPLLKQLNIHSPAFLSTVSLPTSAGDPSDAVLSRTRIIVGAAVVDASNNSVSTNIASIAPNGADAPILAANAPCDPYFFPLALTRDGSWVACNRKGGSFGVSFFSTTLAAAPAATPHPASFFWPPKHYPVVGAWAPDGERIALGQKSNDRCAIDFYRVHTARAEVRALTNALLPLLS